VATLLRTHLLLLLLLVCICCCRLLEGEFPPLGRAVATLLLASPCCVLTCYCCWSASVAAGCWKDEFPPLGRAVATLLALLNATASCSPVAAAAGLHLLLQAAGRMSSPHWAALWPLCFVLTCCCCCWSASVAAGCWKDEFPPLGRAVATLLLASSSMTVEACTQLAWSRGYAIAALQYSNECYASESAEMGRRL
jgi:hypothetical protein